LLLGLISGCQPGTGKPEFYFDGNRAMALLKTQCSFGPRHPGSEGHAKFKPWLIDQLEPLVDEVRIQRFNGISAGRTCRMENVIGRKNITGRRRILLGTHFDTRPFADHDAEPANRTTPITGANDGASGVAVLLELARQLDSKVLSEIEVDLVFFDGEDSGEPGNDGTFCLGSRHFAENIPSGYYQLGIIIDMIGDADLEIYREGISNKHCRMLVDAFWDIALRTAPHTFFNTVRYRVLDDHVPLIQKGVSTILIIDFDYSFWHTTKDIPEHCSARSLETVGRALLEFLYSIK